MDETLLARLEEIQRTFGEVESDLLDPHIHDDPNAYADLSRRHSELKGIVEDFVSWQQALHDREEAIELAVVEPDEDMRAEFTKMAAERAEAADRLVEALRFGLVPKDPDDTKDVILEIRAGVGGDEAGIWAGDLMRMYQRFAERHNLRMETLSTSEAEAGGYKEISVAVKGKGAFGQLKYEAGVHRVQRVPRTESQGRVHTSTATVAVLPEAEEVELELDMNDVRVDVFRSSGPGGQSVNTTDSAVRLTHEPTGVVVSCQDEKSQLQNKEKAFRILRARLYEAERERQATEYSEHRRSQVGTGNRSEKIRTYNYKDNRVTDHRIGLTIKQLTSILDGDLDEFVTQLQTEEMASRLAEGD
jgi:peptide chain release factor 1